jgi:hypothetical protein
MLQLPHLRQALAPRIVATELSGTTTKRCVVIGKPLLTPASSVLPQRGDHTHVRSGSSDLGNGESDEQLG